MWLDFLYNVLMLIVVFTTFFVFKDFLRVNNSKKLSSTLFIIFAVIIIVILFVSETYFSYYSFDNEIILITISSIIIITSYFYIDKRTILLFPFVVVGIDILNYYYIIENQTNYVLIWNISSIISIAFFIYIIDRIGKNLSNKISFSILFFLFYYAIFIFAVYFLNTNTYTTFNYWSTIFIPIFYYGIFFGMYFLFNKVVKFIYRNLLNLESFLIQDSVSFYKIALYKEKLINYIKKNNIEIGALGMFEISSSLQRKFDRHDLLMYFRNELSKEYNNIIFLRFYSKTYAFFIPFEKEKIDLNIIYQNNNFINREQDIFEPIDNSIKEIDHFGKKIDVGISFYGIHSNNVDELSYLSNSMLKITKVKRIKSILVYDYRKVYNSINDKRFISSFLKDRLSIKFYKLNNQKKVYYCEYKLTDKKFSYVDLTFKNLNINERILIERYLAILSIKEFFKERRDNKLIINYSSEFLSREKIDIDRFKNKIWNYTNYLDIIIGLDLTNFKPNDIFKNNVKALQESGFNFAIINNSENIKNYKEILKPIYIINKREEKLFFDKYI